MKRTLITCLLVAMSLAVGGVGGYWVGRRDNQKDRTSDHRLARKLVMDSMFVVGAPKSMFEELCVQAGVSEVTPGTKRYFYILKDKPDLLDLKEGDVIGFNVEFDANDTAVVVDRVHHVHAQ